MDADTFPVLPVHPSSRNTAPRAKVVHKNLVAKTAKHITAATEFQNAANFRFQRVKQSPG
jgi:hypothetical protein